MMLAVSMLTAASFASFAAEPSKVWEVTGLKEPESALFDPGTDAIYVSNVNGGLADKDGNGFISKLTSDGKMIALEWAGGLHAPKGLALANGKLYVTDIDQLVIINLKDGHVLERLEARGAKFLNDATADAAGRVYATDMLGNAIWVLDNGEFSLFVGDEALANPNGVLAIDGRLIIASCGKMASDMSTKVPGHLKSVDLTSKQLADLGDATPIGNLDGVISDGQDGFYLTDLPSGRLFHAAGDGKAVQILSLGQGSADLGVGPEDGLLLIPMMKDGSLVAYRVK